MLTLAPSHASAVAHRGTGNKTCGFHSCCYCSDTPTPSCTQENGQKWSLMRKQGQTALTSCRAGSRKHSDWQLMYPITPFYLFPLCFPTLVPPQTALTLSQFGFPPHPKTGHKSPAIPRCSVQYPAALPILTQAVTRAGAVQGAQEPFPGSLAVEVPPWLWGWDGLGRGRVLPPSCDSVLPHEREH